MASLNELEGIRRKFFNGHAQDSKKASWLNWNNVLMSKDRGGLGVSSLNPRGGVEQEQFQHVDRILRSAKLSSRDDSWTWNLRKSRGEYKEVKDSQGSLSTQAQNEPSTSTYQHNQDKKQQRIVNEESLFIEGDDVVRVDVDEEEMGSVLEMITGKMKMTYSEVDMVNLALKDI
ncbi:hypothetical protein Tco_0981111, partial [Tanacetum coccineum]